ncbi:maltooligosyl trehalose synthase [Jatrophihabitans sp. GAS493]|uniref:malto-oligosyltrehalose synthase n=1 Tax=Jatrophihabitans sp. GAS493 TaxID=1907575 RepID=UPI000BB724AB|nr:malto-oligosyltrehalose synthase [Jatrophihabitans sp. GAS493]SOD74045.1 maltooligosyl trehalose synthase [Jatrophihabitans sp. GAS493]
MAHSPTSTYRLQIRPSFELDAAAALVDYLDALGADAAYLSPILRSADGSDHGYDVVDHSVIDPARGGDAGWRRFIDAAGKRGRGVVVDIVPNHAGVADASQNAAWWDVLRLGQASRFARWFDIEWSRGRLLIPVLGDDFDAGNDLKIEGDELRYFDHRYPIAPDTSHPGDTPAEVHDRQHYQLVSYHLEQTEQNYRRFFAVTSLAGLRVEDEAVFDATHARVLDWVRHDGIIGLRLDHPDGLADPAGYLERLRAATGDCWITVEKILEPGEQLPTTWPVAGTTGYDALTEVSNVLIDPTVEPRFDALYRELSGDALDFHEHVARGKRTAVETILQAEVSRLARLVPSVERARDALAELLIAFPVYRSYLPDGREYLDQAVTLASSTRPDLAATIAALLPQLANPVEELCARFQQTSGAVMAKGVEDTAYYRYNRFVALNEVGGNPAQFGGSVAEFHQAQQVRQRVAPLGMTTLSTHDTKRGEDVRARLFALSEFGDAWAATVRGLLTAAPIPNASFAYLLWQTFVGVGFIDRGRMHAYAEKAMREAADGTGWADPDESFEQSVHAAVDAAYDRPEVHQPLAELISTITGFGWSNSLSQKLIQLTMPGIPDVYQGTELWEDSLVDPDNRRPVDFNQRRGLLARLGRNGRPLIDESGAAKLLVVSRTLAARRDHPELFGGYTPITGSGAAAEHLVGYDRGGAITLATRLPAGLQRRGGWGSTAVQLGDATFLDVFTGRTVTGSVELSSLLDLLPVALLLPQ